MAKVPNNHDGADHCCSCHLKDTCQVHQTLEEMDFDRGIWSAALYGDTSRVKEFLDNKAVNPNIVDSSGYTALHYASRNGHIEVCRLLVSRGADVNCTTRSGCATPLHRAAFSGHANVVEFLLAAKADPEITDCDGKTPLHKAASQGHVEICTQLMKSHLQLKFIKDIHGRTPWDEAHENAKTVLS